MHLKDIKTFVVGNPPPSYGGRYFVFVKLTTNTGVTGVGEAYCGQFSPHLVAKLMEDVFARYMQGMDPHRIETMWRRVYSAGFTQRPDITMMGVMSALEMACWDIVGKEANQPIYNLLGGKVHEKLRSYTDIEVPNESHQLLSFDREYQTINPLYYPRFRATCAQIFPTNPSLLMIKNVHRKPYRVPLDQT